MNVPFWKKSEDYGEGVRDVALIISLILLIAGLADEEHAGPFSGLLVLFGFLGLILYFATHS